MCLFFFFKQKTAYEMRISDWSSDVCSSDLALARQLLERYLAESEIGLDQIEVRARELDDDPLHAFLIFLKLYSEMVRDMIAQHPGCIVSTLTYQDRLFDETVVRLNREGMLAWRARFLRRLEEIVPVTPPSAARDVTDLADQMSATADGTIHR